MKFLALSMHFLIYFQRRDGTVMMVYGPPLPPDIPNCLDFSLLSQEYSQVMVPQPPYVCGNTQKDWDQKPPILFFKWGRLGMKLSDAMKKEFKGMDDRDKFPFEDKRGITIRIHVSSWGHRFADNNSSLAPSFRGTLPAPMSRRN